MDRLSEGGELNEEEQTQAVEMLATLLARREVNRLHVRALEEDEIREAVKLADRLRARGELSAREPGRPERAAHFHSLSDPGGSKRAVVLGERSVSHGWNTPGSSLRPPSKEATRSQPLARQRSRIR